VKVVDAGVVVAALIDTADLGFEARHLLEASVAAPALIDIEVLSALRRLVSAGTVEAQQAARAVQELRALGFERVRHEPLLPRCWELRANVTPYDAAYVALAEVRRSALVTLDRRLARAPGPRCEFEVL
jgi:predicted nucleic acid-binding protein